TGVTVAVPAQTGRTTTPPRSEGQQTIIPPANYRARSTDDMDREIRELRRIVDSHVHLIAHLARATAFMAQSGTILQQSDIYDPVVRTSANYLAWWSQAPWYQPINRQ